MAAFHTRLRQGTKLIAIVMNQLQFPAPRLHKCSCCAFCQFYILRPDIRRTLWSSRPDTVFLLESSQFLTDLARRKVHTARLLIKYTTTAISCGEDVRVLSMSICHTVDRSSILLLAIDICCPLRFFVQTQEVAAASALVEMRSCCVSF